MANFSDEEAGKGHHDTADQLAKTWLLCVEEFHVPA